MKFNNILQEQIRIKNKLLLENVSRDLLPQQRYIVEGIYNELMPLIEATISADKIKDLFGEIEKQSIAGGNSRTLAGGAVDVVKKANEIINNTGKWIQNTTPVKNFDQKFEDLKTKASEKFPDLSEKLSSLGDWAKENPGKTAAVIGVLTAVASLAGGPVGGAIAGQVLRGTVELLKGEKLSTAVGKGLKTAAIGWLAGMTMDAVGDMISDVYSQFNPIPIDATNRYWEINVGNGMPDIYQEAAFYGSKEEYAAFKDIWADAVKEWQNGDFDAAVEAFETARDFAETATANTLNKIALDGDPQEKMELLGKALDGLTAAAQGAAAGATAYDKQGNPVGGQQDDKSKAPAKESFYLQTRPLSEGQVYILFDHCQDLSRVEYIAEGPMDMLKKGAAAVGKGLSWAGKQATEKITSAKLLASWKLEGSPTDSAELAEFLKGQGVEDAVIAASYETMSLPAPGTGSEQKKEPTLAAAEFKPGQAVTYTNAKGETKQATVVKQLDTVDAQGDPQIQLKAGAATFAVDKDRIQAAAQSDQPAAGDQYQQAVAMVTKLPTERKARLLKALLKNAGAAGAQTAQA